MPDGPWTKYAQQPASEEGPWTKYGDAQAPAPDQQPQEQPSGVLSGIEQGVNDVVGGLTSLPHALAHPIDTLGQMGDQQTGLANRAIDDVKTGHYGNALWHGIDAALPILGPMDAALTDQYQSGDKSGAIARGVVNALPYALPHLMGTGEGLKGMGGKMIDRTVGLRKADLAHGAQPGRAYLEGGGGPALSIRSLANKAENVQNKAGTKLGQAYRAADASGVKIPASRVLDEVSQPASELRAAQEGPGGTGESPLVKAFEDRLLPPISAAEARGGFAPSELFDQMKQPISKSTRWNDSSMFDLNNVRQQTTGRIGGLLTDAVPETRQLNKIYQGSGRLADRAAERAESGQAPLSRIGRRAIEGLTGAGLGMATGHPAAMLVPMALDSVPVRTTLAKALFTGGKVLPAATPLAKTIGPLAGVSGVGRPKPGPKSDTNY